MVLEQGALSGKYGTAHPFPEGSDRANAYGGSLAEIEELNKAICKSCTVAYCMGNSQRNTSNCRSNKGSPC